MATMVGGFPACCFGEVFSLGRYGFGGVLLLGLLYCTSATGPGTLRWKHQGN